MYYYKFLVFIFASCLAIGLIWFFNWTAYEVIYRPIVDEQITQRLSEFHNIEKEP